MSKVLIIGGGAAGMMAAVAAGENGHEVWLYEKNDRLGRKLFITGKGRCNITNAGDMETLFASVMSNPKFLYSSFYTFTNDQVIEFFEELGVRTKIERGNRVFPLSDHSSDVIAGLKRKLETLGGPHLSGNRGGKDRGKRREVPGNRLKRRTAKDRRCLYCCNRRNLLPGDRIYRRRIPVRKRKRTSDYKTLSGAGSDGSQGMVCKGTAGALSSQCKCSGL